MKLKHIIILIFPSICFSQKYTFYTIGPSIHLNFGKPNWSISYGFESSLWIWASDGIAAFGVDLGTEYEKGKIRLYGEFQLGSLIGISMGPVYELDLKNQNKINKGHQISTWFGFGGEEYDIWGFYFAPIHVFDYRYRKIENQKRYILGTYIKKWICGTQNCIGGIHL